MKRNIASEDITWQDFRLKRASAHVGCLVYDLEDIWRLGKDDHKIKTYFTQKMKTCLITSAFRMTKVVQQEGCTVHCLKSERLQDVTCCTVEFPPFKIAIPSFNVAATIGPVSP